MKSDEIFIALFLNKLCLLRLEINFVSQKSTKTSKSFDKLSTFRRFIRNELQLASIILIMMSNPLS